MGQSQLLPVSARRYGSRPLNRSFERLVGRAAVAVQAGKYPLGQTAARGGDVRVGAKARLRLPSASGGAAGQRRIVGSVLRVDRLPVAPNRPEQTRTCTEFGNRPQELA